MDRSMRALGYKMHAEWAPQEAVWFAWPKSGLTAWPRKLKQVQLSWAAIVTHASRFQDVCILCPEIELVSAKSLLSNACFDRLRFFNLDYNDVWCRDYAPTFILDEAQKDCLLLDWTYNAWGEKFPYDKDAHVCEQLSTLLSKQRVHSKLVCEGGAIESNGMGQLMTTRSVLQNKNRNPDWTEPDIESELKACTGANEIVWLEGGLNYDDTDGHVDMCARFFNETGVVYVPGDKPKTTTNHTLCMNKEILSSIRTDAGGRLDLIELPVPDPVVSAHSKEPLPISYANFLILNHAVLVPTYRQAKQDEKALGLLRELFPHREVVGVDCLDIVEEGGAVHCLSQHQPLV